MADVTIKRIADLDYYQGPHAIPDIRFRYASKGLGFAAWELNVLEIEPNGTGYPEHDHAKDGAEEVYVILRGSATLRADDEEWHLETGTLIRVGAHQKRKFIAGPDGAAILAI